VAESSRKRRIKYQLLTSKAIASHHNNSTYKTRPHRPHIVIVTAAHTTERSEELINSLENQTLALAGLFLSAELVHNIANSGDFDDGHIRIVLESVFTLDADTVESVYGGKHNLRAGQQRLVDQLHGTDSKSNLQITQYILNLLKLENKCQSDSALLSRMRRGIESAEQMRIHYDTLDNEVISLLAKVYTDNISNLSPRIVVHGNREYLEQELHANRIRACLLAGIRSAVLWQQCGGTRWKIVSGRKKYVQQARKDLGLI